MQEYYIYCHINLVTGQPFYIGKGKGNRAYSKTRSNWWKRVVAKYGYDILIIESDLDEQESFRLEKYYIARLGRLDNGTGILINMTAGGEGTSGYKHTKQTKVNLSLSSISSQTWSTRFKLDNIEP